MASSRSRRSGRRRRTAGATYVIRKSTRPDKKYMAVFGAAGRAGARGGKTVHFGATGYEHYRDSTPLRLYSRLDHLDPARRRNFKSRFERSRHVVHSAAWFADKYLW